MESTTPSPNFQKLGLKLDECSFGATKRELYPYDANETPSYVPNLFLGNGTPQLAMHKPPTKEEEGFLWNPVDDILKTDLKIVDFTQFVESLKEDIQNHVETRLQLFFMLLSMVSQTGLVFHKYSTKGQVGSKKKEKQEDTPAKLVEAHASTLPNLQFITMDQMKMPDATQIEPRILAMGSAPYKYLQTTHKLPLFVNEIDSSVDKNTPVPFYDNFRHRCLKIVNDVSQNSTSFIWEGYKAFLLTLLGVINLTLKSEIKPKVKYKVQTLKLYQKVVQAYISKVDDAMFRKSLTLTHKEKGSLSERVQKIQKNIGVEVQCHVEFMKVRDWCTREKKLQKVDLLARCILISLANPKITLIDKYLKTHNSAEYTEIRRKRVSQSFDSESIKAAAYKVLEESDTPKKIEQNLSELVQAIKAEQSAKLIADIAIRVLAKTSLEREADPEREEDNPEAHKMYHYLSMSPGKVADVVIADAGVFDFNWDALRRETVILRSYQALNQLLDQRQL